LTLEERDAVGVLGRALALALRDSTVRHEIKEAIAASTAKEHKLELASFLEGRGGHIFTAIAKSNGPRTSEIQHAVAQLPRLEFYMPVTAHAAQWRGDGDVILAVWQGDSVPPVGFALDGTPVTLDQNHPPATPTLVAVPMETDLSEQALQNRQGVGYLCASSLSETLAQASDRCGGSILRASAMRSIPAPMRDLGTDPNAVGLYMTFLRLLDAHEYWYEGSPEIEVHVTGRRSPSPAQPIDYQCAGEHAADAAGYQPGIRSQSYVFDMNSNFWSGDVMLLSPAQVDTLQANLPDGFNVSVWEDDDTACQIKQNNTTLFQTAVTATTAITNGVNAVKVHNYDVVAGAVQTLASLIQGDDDYAGLMVFKDSTSYAGTNPGTTHMIYDGTTLNGRATLVFKTTSYTPPSTGAVSSMEMTPAVDTVGISEARQFNAIAYDASGQPIANPSITWQTSNSGIAQVNSTGFVSGVASGSVTITATSSGVSVTAPLTVKPAVTAASVTGPSLVNGCVSGTWTGHPTGGTAPYTYAWTVENGSYNTGTNSQLVYTNQGSALSIFVKVTITDANGTYATSPQFKTNLHLPGSC
jgi:hypothetical protein